MKLMKMTLAMTVAGAVSACSVGNKQDKSIDRGFDAKSLSELQAGIWVDPNGCHHWIIDDGIEGYLSARLDDSGKPICNDTLPPNTANGDFKSGSIFGDPI